MMKTLSPDTHIEVERIHISLIRKAPFFLAASNGHLLGPDDTEALLGRDLGKISR